MQQSLIFTDMSDNCYDMSICFAPNVMKRPSTPLIRKVDPWPLRHETWHSCTPTVSPHPPVPPLVAPTDERQACWKKASFRLCETPRPDCSSQDSLRSHAQLKCGPSAARAQSSNVCHGSPYLRPAASAHPLQKGGSVARERQRRRLCTPARRDGGACGFDLSPRL